MPSEDSNVSSIPEWITTDDLSELVCRNCHYPYHEPVKALGGNACDNFEPMHDGLLAVLEKAAKDLPLTDWPKDTPHVL